VRSVKSLKPAIKRKLGPGTVGVLNFMATMTINHGILGYCDTSNKPEWVNALRDSKKMAPRRNPSFDQHNLAIFAK